MNAMSNMTSYATIAPSPRLSRRGVAAAGLAGWLLISALATAGPAAASIPVDRPAQAAKPSPSVVLVNGVNTMAGVTEKLTQLS